MTGCSSNSYTRLMRSIIQRIATGPEMSKDISRQESREGMRLILEKKVDSVQAAVFLIALRMKRETDDENLGILEAIQDATKTVIAPVDYVIDIADPYDGFTRHLPASPFLPAVLAACGMPALCHGLESVGPKHGVTSRQVLRAARVNVDCCPEEAGEHIGDPRIGWCYLDQKAFCPMLHDLVNLRTLIVKRPSISTIETMTAPVRGQHATHLVTGYVHRAYPRIYALLAQQAGFNSALIVRGVEGGVIPSLRQPSNCFGYTKNGEVTGLNLDPNEIGIAHSVKAVPIPDELLRIDGDEKTNPDIATLAQTAAKTGLKALEGQSGMARDSLVYAGAAALWRLGGWHSFPAAADAVRGVLNSGKALEHLVSNTN